MQITDIYTSKRTEPLSFYLKYHFKFHFIRKYPVLFSSFIFQLAYISEVLLPRWRLALSEAIHVQVR